MEASAFEIALLILVGVLLLIPLVIKFVSSLLAYRQESRYLYMELQRSESEEERGKWRRALSYERLCLLPFVTPKNVRSVYRFFHKPGKGRVCPFACPRGTLHCAVYGFALRDDLCVVFRFCRQHLPADSERDLWNHGNRNAGGR